MVEVHSIALLVLAPDHPPGRIESKLHFAVSRIARVATGMIGIGFFGFGTQGIVLVTGGLALSIRDADLASG